MTAHAPTKDLVPAFQRAVFAPLQREFNRFFDELGDGWAAFAEAQFAPRMDVVEGKDAIDLSIELPGLTRDDVKIIAADDVLTVSGKKSAESTQVEGSTRLSERSFGEFSRSVYLPRSVDPTKIEAKMVDGVLKVRAPKRPDAVTKTIEIQSQ